MAVSCERSVNPSRPARLSAGVSMETWGESEKTSEWKWRERETESNVRMEQKQPEDLRSKVCAFIPQRNVTRSIRVKLYRQLLWHNMDYHRKQI